MARERISLTMDKRILKHLKAKRERTGIPISRQLETLVKKKGRWSW